MKITQSWYGGEYVNTSFGIALFFAPKSTKEKKENEKETFPPAPLYKEKDKEKERKQSREEKKRKRKVDPVKKAQKKQSI